MPLQAPGDAYHRVRIGFAGSEPCGAKDVAIWVAADQRAEFLLPLTYIFGDVFTEVYGYGASRRAIWLGLFAMGLLALMGQLAVALPPAPGWKGH